MDKPHPVRERGDMGLLDWLDQLLDFTIGSRPLRSENCELHETTDGTQILPTATGTGGGITSAGPRDFTVVDASDKDHLARVRVYNGEVGGLRPAEMKIPDAILPDGTDNRCYLTALNGTSYVMEKTAVMAGTGLFTGAHVYVVATVPPKDASFLYRQIATLTLTAGSLAIEQDAVDSVGLSILAGAAADSPLTPVFTPV